MQLNAGDKISVPGRAGTSHVGVYTGGGTAVHNSKDHLRVVEEPISAFASGSPITIVARAKPGTESLVVQRARDLIGTSYNLFFWNCEHLAAFAQTGRPASTQLQFGLALAGAVAAVLAVAYDQRGYDVRVDRHRDSRGRFRSTIF